MARVEHIGNCTLYLGDCREIMPSLPSVDAVVTDPPYGTNVTEWDETIDAATVAAILDKTPGYSVFFYSNTRLEHLLSAIRAHGNDTWVAVWHKPNAMGFERRFAPQWVPVVIAYKGNPPFWGKDLFACSIVKQKIDHPTPKQPGITQWLVERSSKPAGTVFDPYMGSGTTGSACVKLGRKFIGVERVPKYFDISCKRIDDASRQSELLLTAV